MLCRPTSRVSVCRPEHGDSPPWRGGIVVGASGITSRQAEKEPSSLSSVALRPYSPAMSGYRTLDDREADAGPGKFGLGVQTLENFEQLAVIAHVKTRAVVLHLVNDFPVRDLTADLDALQNRRRDSRTNGWHQCASQRTYSTRYRATAASFHSTPEPGRSSRTAQPSTMRSGCSMMGLNQSAYSSQCAVGVTHSR